MMMRGLGQSMPANECDSTIQVLIALFMGYLLGHIHGMGKK